MDKGGEKNKIIYKELSYKIIGSLFEVYNTLGYGHPEKYYYKAIENEFQERKIKFKGQVPYNLIYKGNQVGKYFLDYLVEDRIVLEIKKGNYFSKKNIEQVKGYLQASKLK
jgi:GxxExxY protein